MPRSLSARRAVALAAACAALTLTAGGMAASAAPRGNKVPDAGTGDSSAVGGVDRASALVRLSQDPLSASPGVARGREGRVDLGATATKNVRAQLNKQRNALKQWLRANAPAATVTGEFDISMNAVAVQLNGTSLDLLRSAPNVVSASYQATYAPLAADDPDLSLINAQAGWKAAGFDTGANADSGVKVAVIDTGIDADHPCFDGGRPDPSPGDSRTSARVTFAGVYNNKARQRGLSAVAVQDLLTTAVDDLDRAGMVVAVAEGPGTRSRCRAPRALRPGGPAPGR